MFAFKSSKNPLFYITFSIFDFFQHRRFMQIFRILTMISVSY